MPAERNTQHKSKSEEIPLSILRLQEAYPQSIKEYDGKYIVLANGLKVEYNRGGNDDIYNDPGIDELFYYQYTKGQIGDIPKNHDPGRIRHEELLKKMYGSTPFDVQRNLVMIDWCPTLVGQKLPVTRINRVDIHLKKISDELDKCSEMKDYLVSAGTFNWRKIKGENRLSAHSFGTAIDIGVKYANYWLWDYENDFENQELKYRNRIPQSIIDIFEKHGFIWGGKWYHYDTMHFEYKPELLL